MSEDRRLGAAGAALALGSQRGEVEAFIVMDILKAANDRERAGERIVHMEVGQPGTPAPRTALEAARRALDSQRLGYTDALGLPTLRERIARHYRESYGCGVDPARVVVTAGSSAAFVLSFLALFDPGDRVAIAMPGYPCYRHILTALGCTPVLLAGEAGGRWMPDVAQLRAAAAAGPLRGLLLASPANPTGTMLAPERLAALAEACRELGIALVSDEIYHGLTYEKPATTALSVAPEAVVVNSFSKYFSMTGWRIGWLVVPEGLVRPLERLAQNLYISPPTLSQIAAEAAFEGREELEGHRAVYARNREILLDGLPRLGIGEILPADGAFYIYAESSAWGSDSFELARRLLADTGVAVTPGIDFDPARGRRYLRFSYAGPTDDMSEALRRLAAWRR